MSLSLFSSRVREGNAGDNVAGRAKHLCLQGESPVLPPSRDSGRSSNMTVTMVTWSSNVTVTSVTWSSSVSVRCWESAQGTVCEHSVPSISARGTGTSSAAAAPEQPVDKRGWSRCSSSGLGLGGCFGSLTIASVLVLDTCVAR